jgi:ribosome-binding factor A
MMRDPSPWMRRVNSSLRQVLATEVEALKDPRLGFVTITAVDTSPDLRSALVLYSVLGTPEEQESTGVALAAATPRLQRAVGRSVRLKFTPRLSFRLDETLERGARIAAALRQIESEEEAGGDVVGVEDGRS